MARPVLEGLLGPLERQVIAALWDCAPCDVATVRRWCNQRRDEPLAYTTVMTVLVRLFDKELVVRERHGRGYRYEARYEQAALVDHLGSQEVRRVLDRYGDVALAHFAAALDEADPDLLERLHHLRDTGG